eukprot:67797-Chlamydomonas_euryale.AAC.1
MRALPALRTVESRPFDFEIQPELASRRSASPSMRLPKRSSLLCRSCTLNLNLSSSPAGLPLPQQAVRVTLNELAEVLDPKLWLDGEEPDGAHTYQTLVLSIGLIDVLTAILSTVSGVEGRALCQEANLGGPVDVEWCGGANACPQGQGVARCWVGDHWGSSVGVMTVEGREAR